jgi:hypothetical protein
MRSKVARLRLAALAGIACMFPAAFAADAYRTFTLTWDSPTENEDGSPLTDLQGYYVYVGQSPEALLPMYFTASQSVMLGQTAFGPRYFAVSAVNTSGVESALTAVLSEPVEPAGVLP